MGVRSSNRQGTAIPNFPDVCTTPASGGPVPIPYPNIGKTTDAEPAQLRSKIGGLHLQLMALPSADAERWHALLDEYVMAVAKLYVSVASR